MSMTHAMQAIKQAIQRKSNCNSGQESKHNDYDDYGDYSETHSGHYHMDLSEGECHGDYGDVHGDYYDLDVSEYESLDDGNYSEVHGDYYDMDMPAESVAEKPVQNMVQRIKNRLFQNTK